MRPVQAEGGAGTVARLSFEVRKTNRTGKAIGARFTPPQHTTAARQRPGAVDRRSLGRSATRKSHMFPTASIQARKIPRSFTSTGVGATSGCPSRSVLQTRERRLQSNRRRSSTCTCLAALQTALQQRAARPRLVAPRQRRASSATALPSLVITGADLNIHPTHSCILQRLFQGGRLSIPPKRLCGAQRGPSYRAGGPPGAKHCGPRKGFCPSRFSTEVSCTHRTLE